MQEFDRLIQVLERLLGPDGCPWDREQTLASLRESVLEEVHEVIEAIDLNDTEKLVEELGDLLFNVAFFCKVGEKYGLFNTKDVMNAITDKLIRRHPHVFGEGKVNDMEGLINQWERLKKEEQTDRASAVDGIPATLPTLARAQKFLKKVGKTAFPPRAMTPAKQFGSEEELGQALLDLVRGAMASKLDAELALRKLVTHEERTFRQWEANH